MTPLEISVYMEERKIDYYTFGFAAALLESRKQKLPLSFCTTAIPDITSVS